MQFKFSFNPSLKRRLAPGDRRIWLLRSIAWGIKPNVDPLWSFEIYHRRLLLSLSLLTVSGWLLAVTGLFLWLDQKPRNQVGWSDLAAPWHWAGLRAKHGDTAVLVALDQIKAKDYANAFYQLGVGLARSPANVEGRLALAALQADYNPKGAVTLLEEGIRPGGYDPRLLNGLLSLYARFQVQSHALTVVSGLLADGPTRVPPESRRLLQRAQVVLLLQMSRYAEAEEFLRTIPPAGTDAAGQQDLQAELLLRTGRAAAAKKHSDEHGLAESPAHFRQAAEIAIALEDAGALQSALRRIKAQSPNDYHVYLFAFQAWHRMKRPGFRAEEEQKYYQAYARNEEALQAFAALAVNLDLPEIVTRTQQVAVNAHFSPFAFRVHQTELALRRGEMDRAIRYLRDWEGSLETLPLPQRYYPEFIRRLTHTAFSGTPAQISYLLGHLAANRGQALLPVYNLALSVLEKNGHLTGAGQVLEAGARLYPQSEPLLVSQKRLAGQLALAPSTAVTPAAPEPPSAASRQTLPATAEDALAQVDGLLLKDALAAARDLLRAIRVQKPAWQEGRETELALREIELAFLSLDRIAGRSTARTYLYHHQDEAAMLQLVTLVSRLVARNYLVEARLLYDEIAAAPSATERIQQALLGLKLTDDLAAVAANEMSTLAAFDRHILTQEWVQAESLLKYLVAKPPAWLAAAQSQVKVREIQIRLGLDQRPMALAALQDLTSKSGAPRSAAFKLIRDLLARGEKKTALLLAREIARLLPDNPAAVKLLKTAAGPPP